MAIGDVSIYPNPTNGQFVVDYNATTGGDYLVRIFDMTGQVVFSQSYSAGVGQIEVASHARIAPGGTGFTHRAAARNQ